MRNQRSAVFLACLFAAPLVAAPLREKPATPIMASNVQQIKEIAAIERDATRIGWVPNSGALALMPWEGDLEIMDTRTFKPIRKLAAGKKLVNFAFSADGERLAWAENNSSLTIEELKTGKTLSFDTESSQPSPAFTPNGKWIATGGVLWDAATGKKIRDFDTGAKGGLTPAFSPDGKTFALGDRNSDPRLFETETGKLLHVLPGKMTQGIAFNPTGTVLATTYVDGSLGLWDVASGKSLHHAKSGGQELYSVDWSLKGDLLVTSGLNSKIILWDAKDLTQLKVLDASEWVIKVRFSPDGSRVYSAGGSTQTRDDRKITVWGLPAER